MNNIEKNSLTKHTLAIFWRHTRPYWPYLLVTFAGTWAALGIEVYRPWLYRRLLNIFAGSTTGYEIALRVMLELLGLGLTSVILRRIAGWAEMIYQSNAKRDLWLTSFKQLHRQSFGYLSSQLSGSLVKRANRYDSSYESLVDQLTSGLGQTILRVIIIIFAIAFFRTDIALIFLVWVLIYICFVLYMVRWKRPIDLEKAETDSKVSGWLADTVSNFTTIKMFASSQKEDNIFEQKVNHFRAILIKQWRAAFRLEAGQAVLVVILEIGIFLVALQLWRRGLLTVGDMALIQLYVSQLNGQLWSLGRQIKAITQSLADANEMTEIILRPNEVSDAPNATPLVVHSGSIAFHNASFGYGDKSKVLSRFTVAIPAKQKIALVGTSGGGKTTITKLLLRLYDLTSGNISIDGQDITQVTQDSLRHAIAFVPQEPILFHRSLLDNIRYGKPDASEAEVVTAAKLAHAHEFITKSSDGYETLVGERGIKLSGGERQRVAIARAILKDAPILLLDEATSSLDSESEMLIQDALKHLMKNKTVLVIAHRLSTIMQMDRILVLDKGKVIEDGKHAELIKVKQGVYQKLWDIQAGSFN